MTLLPEIPIFKKPDFIFFHGGNKIYISFYQEYPDYIYIGIPAEGITISLPRNELKELISNLQLLEDNLL